MVQRLSTTDATFAADFTRLLAMKREANADVAGIVAGIIADVRTRGDAVLRELTLRFDDLDLTKVGIAVPPGEIEAALRSADPAAIDALRFAADRIRIFHERQRPLDGLTVDAVGAELGHRWTAIEAVALYVPGGQASYPSSVLMNAIPARVAGVPRIAMCVPAMRGELNPMVLAAAAVAGVEEIYRIGGAQAVAAFAYGTETIAPVAKIVGPGNAYVAAAKRQVFGTVGIDSIAGPSEVLVIADRDNDPHWIAVDLLAQAEHDESAQSILITDDAAFADTVAAAVDEQLATLPRRKIAAASWRDFGAIILVPAIADAAPLADRIAAEHLEIATRDPDALAARVRNAGAIFLGSHTPEVIGDYVGGPNHVLPTARSARFSSGLGVLDFMKRTSLMRLDARALAALGPAAMTLAEMEGLDAHRRSVAIRLAGQREPAR